LGIGSIVKATGSFVWALTLIAAMALLGAVSYVFILGDMKRVELVEN
jgi:ACS family D-galactonate transporter-like MFS transporter